MRPLPRSQLESGHSDYAPDGKGFHTLQGRQTQHRALSMRERM
jgi:hypothetical protein